MLKVPIVTQTRQGICYILPSGLYCKNYIDFLAKNDMAHGLVGCCVSPIFLCAVFIFVK